MPPFLLVFSNYNKCYRNYTEKMTSQQNIKKLLQEKEMKFLFPLSFRVFPLEFIKSTALTAGP